MSPDQVEKLFNEALEREEPLERARFLDLACGADIALRQCVDKLVRAHEEAAGFLSNPSRKSAGLAWQPTVRTDMPPAEKAGDRIGHYKLLQQIGEGGCGVVYMAEQEEPVRRRVALKIIKLGMDTKQVIARFEAERHALALMDHPNIAKVLDAGATDTGRPYFVMELIRGVKLTDFCDEHNLATEARLQLAVQVCHAIQHAHHKGVVHRDLKPSNILVTINDGVPTPKVIDFGIAKSTQGRLTNQTLFTAFEQFIGTPAYMSPEQAVMTSLDIDTRSDIYSLGVLLYELLTGRPPFEQSELLAAGLDEMRRTIREKDPPKPSTRLSALRREELTTTAKRRQTEGPKLIHRVRGDLDWIVMKCLEKDRTRRYETAAELARDIERHLAIEPVTARPASRWYEFQKGVRRHKFGFAAAAAVVLALILGIIGSTWQAIRATRAEQEQIRLRQEAVMEKQRSEQVAKFMTQMLKGAGPGVARGRDATLLREMMEQTAARIEVELTNQPEVSGDLWTAVGFTYADIGDHAQASKMYARAVTNYQAAFRTNHTKLALAWGHLGAAQSYQEKIAEGSSNAWQGLVMARQLGDERTLASSLMIYASSLDAWGKGAPAGVPYLREAAAIRRKFGTNDSLMAAYSKLAVALTNVSESIEITRETLNYSLQKAGEEDTVTATRRFILGQKLLLDNKPGEAEVELRAALQSWRKLYSLSHPYRDVIYRHLIHSIALQQRWATAEAEIRTAAELDPANDYHRTMLSALDICRGRWPEALTNLPAVMKNKDPFNSSIVLATTGRVADYRQRSWLFLQEASSRRDFDSAERAAKTALLLLPDEPSLVLAGELADYAATTPGPAPSISWAEMTRIPWAQMTKALAEYRRGQFESAIDWAGRGLSSTHVSTSCHATCYFVRALAQTRLGHFDSARSDWSDGTKLIADFRRGIILDYGNVREFWQIRDWIIADHLRHEAEERLNVAAKASKSPP